MAGFSKVFSTIWGGSLYGHFEASAVFLVFLSLADRDGAVDMTPEAIAGTTGWPLDFILKGIRELEKPDAKSRTPGHEGRRILLMDDHRPWGWIITNYSLYRDKMRSAERTAYLAEKQREYRAKQKSQGIKLKQYGQKAAPHDGFVYFIQADNKVKIGFSVQPEERLATLKIGNPLASLIGFKEGSTTLEKELHKRFEQYSAGGEWFDFVEEIREYIRGISPLYTSIQQVYTSTIINQDKPIAEADAESDTEAKNKNAPKGALFEEFWNAYKEAGGEKIGRGQAEKAWKKLNPDHALLTAMLIALQSQKQERADFSAAGQFYENWKHPATWLNGKCWLDEPRNLDKVIHAQPRKLSGPEQVERATAERKRERDQKLIR